MKLKPQKEANFLFWYMTTSHENRQYFLLLSRRHFENSAAGGLGSTIIASLWLALCYVVMSTMIILVLTETQRYKRHERNDIR